jgi:hypothetical protein
LIFLPSEWFVPDPEFWKNLSYSTEWKKHWDNVAALRDKLIRRFPELENAMRFGLGALTDKRLKIPPDEKGEPDVEVFHEYLPLCCIEVSGSDRVNMPKPIWVRPDKLVRALSDKRETWFYMVYPNEIRVLTKETVQLYEKSLITVHIKVDKKTGRKVPETYIEIPYQESSDEEKMFGWISEQVKPK